MDSQLSLHSLVFLWDFDICVISIDESILSMTCMVGRKMISSLWWYAGDASGDAVAGGVGGKCANMGHIWGFFIKD